MAASSALGHTFSWRYELAPALLMGQPMKLCLAIIAIATLSATPALAEFKPKTLLITAVSEAKNIDPTHLNLMQSISTTGKAEVAEMTSGRFKMSVRSGATVDFLHVTLEVAEYRPPNATLRGFPITLHNDSPTGVWMDLGGFRASKGADINVYLVVFDGHPDRKTIMQTVRKAPFRNKKPMPATPARASVAD
jgi:hypothetical protein